MDQTVTLTLPFRQAPIFDATSEALRDLPHTHQAAPGKLFGVVRSFTAHTAHGPLYDSHMPEFLYFESIPRGTTLRSVELGALPLDLYTQASMAYTMARSDSLITQASHRHATEHRRSVEVDTESFQAFVLRNAVVFEDRAFKNWRDAGGPVDAAQKAVAATEVLISENIANHALFETITGVEAFLTLRLMSHRLSTVFSAKHLVDAMHLNYEARLR